MFKPADIIEKAKNSGFYRSLLNWSLDRMIPFNKPHDFKIVEIGDYHLKTRIPYGRKNFNHIRGLHACALATISEFTTGFLLASVLSTDKYRLIMKRLEMNYHYQGKMDAFAEFRISKEWLQQNIFEPLGKNDAVEINCEVKVYDVKGNHLTTGNVFWHVKNWEKVKTKVVA
jgi:acyl-coenzyme A thioesterase PaaI-like protein